MADSARMTPEQARKNRRLAVILASVAVVFCLGYMAKIAWVGY